MLKLIYAEIQIVIKSHTCFVISFSKLDLKEMKLLLATQVSDLYEYLLGINLEQSSII